MSLRRAFIAAFAIGSALAACAAPPPANEPRALERRPMPAPHASAETPRASDAHSGTLLTYRNGAVIIREDYRDDGDVIRSEIDAAGQKAIITLARKSRAFEIDYGGQTIKQTIPEGTIALENGHWAAFLVAGEQFAGASRETAVKIALPSQGKVVDGSIRVEGDGAHRVVHVKAAGVEANVTIDGGVITAGEVPSQSLDVRTKDAPPPPPPAKRPPPDAANESPMNLDRGGFEVKGDLWLPKTAKAKTPVMVFVAGSGPTDRNGNGMGGLHTDLYRQLATAMVGQGVGTVLYDKRGVGESTAPSTPPVIDDFASDVVAIVEWLRKNPAVGKVYVAGHSEGGLLALLAAQKAPIDGIALLATAGRPFGAILKEQVEKKLGPETAKKLDPVFAAIKAGKPIGDLPEALASFFPPALVPFWKSVVDIDPTALARAYKKPLLIVQGEHDAQVSVDDAKKLKTAAPAATLLLLPRSGHVLKPEAGSDPAAQSSYTDPSRPLDDAVVPALVALTKK